MRLMRMEKTGFTLIEVAIASVILVVALVGLLGVFIGCSGLSELTKNLTIAINGAQIEIERIHNLPFNQISAENGNTFDVSGIGVATSEGSIEVNTVGGDAGLLEVRVTVCWMQKGGRIIGEDTNLNGNLDAGEDSVINGWIDSPAQLVTLITEKKE